MSQDLSLNKPARQVIVDLINRVLIKQFDYRDVTLHLVAGTFDATSAFHLGGLVLGDTPTNAKTRVPTGITVTIAGYRNNLFCNYYRLMLSEYLPNAFVVGDLELTDAQFLQQVSDRYGVYLDPNEIELLKFQQPVADVGNGFYYRWKVKPKANHLVWVGDWYVRVVSADHPDVTLGNGQLGSVDPLDQSNLAPHVHHEALSGLCLPDFESTDQ